MHQFTQDNFQAEVLHSDTPVLVDFTADWCGPCRALDPIVASLDQEWNGEVKVGHLDSDANVDLTMEYSVMGLPTLILFKHGRPVERMMGYMPKEKILAKLRPHLGAFLAPGAK